MASKQDVKFKTDVSQKEKYISNLKNNKKVVAEPDKYIKDKNEFDEPQLKKAKFEKKNLLNKIESNIDEINYKCTKLNCEGQNYNIKICTWNVAGIRAILKKNGIEYLKREDADIIALQETKCDIRKIPNEGKLKGYTCFFLDSKRAGYCGMALYSKKKPLQVLFGLKNKEFDEEGRLITAEYETFYLVNVYVPNAGQKLVTLPKRLKWNEIFKKYVQDLDKIKPVIICGDMNVAHQEIDLKNPKTNTKSAGFTKEEREAMTNLLQSDFFDAFRSLYPDKTEAYTFWSYFNNARSKNIGWRLDYFILSKRLEMKVCDVVNRSEIFGSDHCPVVFYGKL